MEREKIIQLTNKEYVTLVEGAYVACFLLGKDVNISGARGDARTEYNYLYGKVRNNEIQCKKQGNALYVKTEDVKNMFLKDNTQMNIESVLQDTSNVANENSSEDIIDDKENILSELKENYNELQLKYKNLEDENLRLNKQIKILKLQLELENKKNIDLSERMAGMILNS